MSGERPGLGGDPRLAAGAPLPGVPEGHVGAQPPGDGSSVRTAPRRRFNLRSVPIGMAAGFGISDTLNGLGLHWLTWPVVGLLIAFIIVSSLVILRRERRQARR